MERCSESPKKESKAAALYPSCRSCFPFGETDMRVCGPDDGGI